jgi:hypothetical protein
MYSFRQVVEAFSLESTKNNIRDHDRRGQGIWLDPQTNHVVVVLGNGLAAVWNGTTFDRLTKPFYGSLQLNPQASLTEFADFDMLKNMLENYNTAKAPAAFAELTKILTQWNWKSDKTTTTILIAALATASFIQSVFTFRPQVCIVGESNSGKSKLQEVVLKNLFGLLTKIRQKPTEASIRQLAESNSNIIQIDEFEHDKRGQQREDMLKLLRTSTDGGIVSRGRPNGKEMLFSMKHIVWISSIELNLGEYADASRFFRFETQRPERIDGKRPLLQMDPQVIKTIGINLLVFAIKNIYSILHTIKELSEADIENALPRNIDAAAVPAAIAKQLCGWTQEETHYFMYKITQEHNPQKSTDVIEEHENLFQTILYQTIKVQFEELSVAQIIQKIAKNPFDPCENEKEALSRNGIKVIKQEVHLIHVIIKDTLLKNTKWKNFDIGILLKRLKIGNEARTKAVGYKMPMRSTKILLENIIDHEFPLQGF